MVDDRGPANKTTSGSRGCAMMVLLRRTASTAPPCPRRRGRSDTDRFEPVTPDVWQARLL